MSSVDQFERGRLHEKVIEHDRRLVAINGSIDRNADETAGLRSEVAATREEVAAFIATVRVWGKVGTLVFGVVSPVITAVVVYALTQQ